MKTVTLQSTTIKIADSLDEITALRQHNFDLNILKNYGIPPTMQGITRKFSKVLSVSNTDEIHKEINNLFLSFAGVIQGIDYRTSALAWMITEINGKPFIPENEDQCEKLISLLVKDGLKQGHVKQLTDHIKKKYLMNYADTSQGY